MFSWTAWPDGNTVMNSDKDKLYMTEATAVGKTYMAGNSL